MLGLRPRAPDIVTVKVPLGGGTGGPTRVVRGVLVPLESGLLAAGSPRGGDFFDGSVPSFDSVRGVIGGVAFNVHSLVSLAYSSWDVMDATAESAKGSLVGVRGLLQKYSWSGSMFSEHE